MSRSTFALMQDYQARQEALIDEVADNRSQARAEKPKGRAFTKAVKDLYTTIVGVVNSYGPAGNQADHSIRISLPLLPTVVVDEVVKRFQAKNWKAEHNFNDGLNEYDWLDVTPVWKIELVA